MLLSVRRRFDAKAFLDVVASSEAMLDDRGEFEHGGDRFAFASFLVDVITDFLLNDGFIAFAID